MDTKRLRYFCTIIEQGQISRAAQVLHMSQPPLSQRLKELEDELGTTLIIRGSGRWEVTEAGHVLYEHGRRILDQLNDVHDLVKEVGQGFNGQLNIGASSACLSYVTGVLPYVHAKYPKMRYRVSVQDSNLLEKYLINEVLDFAVLLLPVEEKRLGIQYLPKEHFVAVFSPHFAIEEVQAPLGLSVLAEYPLALSRRWCGWGGYRMLMEHWQRQGKRPSVVLDTQNVQMLVRLLEDGLPAIGLIPASEATAQIRTSLEVRSLYGTLPHLQPAVIFQEKGRLSLAARTFIDALMLYAKKNARQNSGDMIDSSVTPQK